MSVERRTAKAHGVTAIIQRSGASFRQSSIALVKSVDVVSQAGAGGKGERLEFDRVELLSALGSAIAGDMGRLRAA